MSIESLTVVLHHSKARGAEKLVMLGIANHDGDGGAWPSMVTLAKYAGVSRDAARKLVVSLERRGEIRRVVNGGGTFDVPSYTRPNRYIVTLRCPSDCDRTTQHRTKADMAVPVFLDLEIVEAAEPFAALVAVVSDPPAEPTPPSEPAGGPPAEPRDEPSLNLTTQLSERNSSNRAREVVAFEPCSAGNGRPCSPNRDGVCIDCHEPVADHLTGELPA